MTETSRAKSILPRLFPLPLGTTWLRQILDQEAENLQYSRFGRFARMSRFLRTLKLLRMLRLSSIVSSYEDDLSDDVRGA